MKKLIIIMIALLTGSSAFAQTNHPCSTCLPEGITFSTQSQIDSFQVNYPNCTEIQGDVSIGGDNITNLDGLNVLTSIGGYLLVHGCDSLTSLTGLEAVTSIGDDLVIGWLYYDGNPLLTDLSGLDNLSVIGGDLQINVNDSLTSLMGLDSLTSVGGNLFISSNISLASLMGLDNVTSIGGSLSIYDNEALVDLTGLENLTSIGGNLVVNSLTSLTGLDNLSSLGGGISIQNCSITGITGLEEITSIEYLFIDANVNLTNLTGLDNLTSIGGEVDIWYNAVLTSLTGLDNVTSIDSNLDIMGNESLTSLTGLDNVTSIGGNLQIQYNGSLTSLAGLDNIDAGSITDLSIFENPNLSTCDVQSICDYLVAPNGTIDINDNATGCNSQQEVEAACIVGIEESSVSSRQSLVSIWPSPSSTSITIEIPATIPQKNTSLTIFNINGQQISKLQVTEPQTVVDLSGLVSGIYFVKVVSDDEVMVGKFVKQ